MDDQQNNIDSMLSPELLAELGINLESEQRLNANNSNSLLCDASSSSNKRSKRSLPQDKDDSIDEAKGQISQKILDQAKSLNKKQRNRLDQYNKRQEREVKQLQYMATLQKHEISDDQRALLTSTRSIGQVATTKQLLSKILKKYKAGLALTAEEEELLFPRGNNIDEADDESSSTVDREKRLHSLFATIDAAPALINDTSSRHYFAGGLLEGRESSDKLPSNLTAKSVDKEEGKDSSAGLLLDVFDFTDDYKEQKQGKSKKGGDKEKSNLKSKKTKTEVTDVPPSIGSSLLMQFKSLRSKISVADLVSSAVSHQHQRDSTEEVVGKEAKAASTAIFGDVDNASIGQFKAYIVEPIENPIDEFTSRVKQQVDASLLEDASSSSSKKKQKQKQQQQMAKPGRPASFNDYCIERVSVAVSRDQKIQEARMLLPVCGMEQEIVEAISLHDVVIVCGQTGSGKSTQIPQFLYEAGFAGAYSSGATSKPSSASGKIIGITQPRRVAATSTAQRVAVELADDSNLTGSSSNSSKSSLGGGEMVGYQVRFDSSTVHPGKTKIKFMTDGILLREITNDLLLRNYSVILLDEAHERNVNTDVLLGMISRGMAIRKQQSIEEWNKWSSLSPEERLEYDEPMKPLKLVIMSATLRVDDFCNPVLFSPSPPIINVDARQYPVVTHFSRRTELSTGGYLKETQKKVSQIHRKLPDGGVLVFLTGRKEVLQMCRKLRKTLNTSKGQREERNCSLPSEEPLDLLPEPLDRVEEGEGPMSSTSALQGLDAAEEADIYDDNAGDDDSDSSGSGSGDYDDTDDDSDIEFNDVTSLLDKDLDPDNSTSIRDSNNLRSQMLQAAVGTNNSSNSGIVSSTSDIRRGDGTATNKDGINALSAAVNSSGPEIPTKAWILPLFAMMSPAQQSKVFHPPPPGYRLIVVATNVAETSITIPGIRYVVDCGRHKERVLEAMSGVSKFEIRWTSKASADQRQGRAGRTGPGHCYRLYSSAFFDQHMPQFKEPEILATPLEDLLLQMRTIGIADVETFPFPTMPSKVALRKALDLLLNLGAIKKPKDRVTSILDSLTNGASLPDSMLGQKLLRQNGYVTALGKLLSRFPINPRFAKVLVAAEKLGRANSSPRQPLQLLDQAIAMVSILADKSPFQQMSGPQGDKDEEEQGTMDPNGEETKRKKKKKSPSLKFHPEGDALARLRALGAFLFLQQPANKGRGKYKGKDKEQSADDIEEAQFCAQHNLVQLSMQKAVQLRSQLKQICSRIFPSSAHAAASKLKSALASTSNSNHNSNINSNINSSNNTSDVLGPPSAEEELLLRQALLVGFCDSIARRAAAGTIKEGSRRKRLTAYISCNPSVTGPLYLHPQSSLYQSDPTADLPEFIVYGSLSFNEKGDTTYMNCTTTVSGSWLSAILGGLEGNDGNDCPLLQWSAPLESPPPFFDRDLDGVMCYTIPRYGAHNWELPPVVRELAACLDTSESSNTCTSTGVAGYGKQEGVYRWFARLLLEGSVLPELRGAVRKDKLKDNSSIITQMKIHPKVGALLSKLVAHRVVNRRTLFEKLVADANVSASSFLCEEIQALLAVEHRKEFRNSWTRLVATIVKS